MPDFIEEKKRQKRLIYILGAVLLITGFVLWLGFFKETGVEPSEPSPSVLQFKEVDIDFMVFKNQFLKELQPFIKIAPLEKEKGRSNPFAPY